MKYITILADETLFGTKYKSDLNKPNSIYEMYTPNEKQIKRMRLKPGTKLCINKNTKKLYYYKDNPSKRGFTKKFNDKVKLPKTITIPDQDFKSITKNKDGKLRVVEREDENKNNVKTRLTHDRKL